MGCSVRPMVRPAATRGSIVTMSREAARTPVIVDALRTPFGRYGGALAEVRPDDLAAIVIRALVERTGIDPRPIEDVILGCANQAGEDNRNVARMAALLAGLPVEVAGQTVNRLCGSGLQAVVSAAHAIAAGDGAVFIAGGVESMTRAPLVMAKPSAALPRGEQTMYDTTLGWRFTNPAWPMPTTRTPWARRPRTSPSATASAAPTRTPSRWIAAAPLGRAARRRPLRRRDRAGRGARGRADAHAVDDRRAPAARHDDGGAGGAQARLQARRVRDR